MTTAQMSDPERGGGAAVGIPVDRTVRPLAPVGWRYGRDVEPLYTLNHDEAAAVNKLRAQKEQARQRDLKACRCDHCEYCRHCWPEDFRPGGLWAGYGAQR